MDTQKRLTEFIMENFYVTNPDDVGLDTHLINTGIVDSTGMLEVIAFIEREFGIRVEDDETTPENLSSVKRMMAFIDRKCSGNQAHPS